MDTEDFIVRMRQPFLREGLFFQPVGKRETDI